MRGTAGDGADKPWEIGKLRNWSQRQRLSRESATHVASKTELPPKRREIAKELVVEEYKFCRDLQTKNIEIMEKSEVYAIGAVAVSAASALSAKSEKVVEITSWLPLAISLLGYIRYLGLDSTIATLNSYFETVEDNYRNDIGWTQYYRDRKGEMLSISRVMVWAALIVGSMTFQYYVQRVTPIEIARSNSQQQESKLTHHPS